MDIKRDMDEEGMANLRAAVVELACKDYAAAYRKGLYLGDLETFFYSDRFRLFSDLDPRWLLTKIRKAIDNDKPLFDRQYSQF